MKKNKFSIALLIATAFTTSLMVSCTKNDSGSSVAGASKQVDNLDTISGFVKGTFLTSKTYHITGDITVKATDSLVAQAGANVIVENHAKIVVQGSLKIIGTSANPVVFNSKENTPGTWGGFQCDSAKAITIKWAKLINTGGPDASGGTTKTLFVNAPINVDVEDSWILNGQDDIIRTQNGAKLTILRNTIISSGSTDGEAINIKSGCTGTVAYNVVFSQAGTGIKLETSATVPFPQTKIDVYNNTVVAGGWRRGLAEPGRCVSIGVGAKANIYNNISVNNYQGLEIFLDADSSVLLTHGNNLFYASQTNYVIADTTAGKSDTINLASNFYPGDGMGMAVSSDKIGVNPMFTSFNNDFLLQNGATTTDVFTLALGSPAIGAGNTTFTPFTPFPVGAAPNKDLGAYPSDGSGNKH